jgi:hypothetical protein
VLSRDHRAFPHPSILLLPEMAASYLLSPGISHTNYISFLVADLAVYFLEKEWQPEEYIHNSLL